MRVLLLLLTLSVGVESKAEQCPQKGAWLQVLGAGGPELTDNLHSTSYLLWINGKARLLVDTGAGSHSQFEKVNADFNHLDSIVFTHLHVDHSSDLAAYVKSSFFTGRQANLTLYGPTGNHLLPSIRNFVLRLFGANGVWPYLSDHLDASSGSFQLIPVNVKAENNVQLIYQNTDYQLSAIEVNHGPLPAVAWRVDIKDGRSFVFSGDTIAKTGNLHKLAEKADVLIAHNAIHEDAGPIAKNLHMPASRIAQIARSAEVNTVLLSHFMSRSLTDLKQTQATMSQQYPGKLILAKELACY